MRNKEKLYRDNVHLDIRLDALATSLIDTAEFQRLEGIKQLGFSVLVYRGAKYSRFEHSVGTYWQAKEIMQVIPQNHLRLGLPFPPESDFAESLGRGAQLIENIGRIVSYAGLLHDVTHIPFGHTLEDEFQGIYQHKHDALESPRLLYVLFDNRSEISGVFKHPEPWIEGLSNSDLRRLLAVILAYRDEVGKRSSEKGLERTFEEILNDMIENRQKVLGSRKSRSDAVLLYLRDLVDWYLEFKRDGLFHPFMSDIVANTICADILDYIKRDVYATGLKMDYDRRVLQYFILGREEMPDGSAWRLALCIRDPLKGIDKMDIATEVLNILSHRHTLAERVYYHKVKVAAGSMLAKALSLVGRPEEPSPTYPISHSGDRVPNSTNEADHVMSVNMTDEGFLAWIEGQADSATGNTAQSGGAALEIGDSSSEQSNEVQLEMGAATGHHEVITQLPSISSTAAKQAKSLVGSLRRRRLYKPVVVITHDMARSERRVEYFSTKYRNRQECQKYEVELASRLGVSEDSLVIYCPSPRPQVKQIETRVLVDRPTVLPLWDDNRFRYQADDICDRYTRLWKLFVFLRPDEYANPMTRQRVTEEFHRFEKFEKVMAHELAPYPWLGDDQKEAWEVYSSQVNSQTARLWHPKLGDLIQDSIYWSRISNLYPSGDGRDLLSQLTVASAALYLHDFEVRPDRFEGLRKSPWSGLEQVLSDSPLKTRLFQNLEWVPEVEREFASVNRGKVGVDEASAVREAYYSVFHKWHTKTSKQ